MVCKHVSCIFPHRTRHTSHVIQCPKEERDERKKEREGKKEKMNALEKNRDRGLGALGDKMVVNHFVVGSGSVDIAIVSVSYTLPQCTVAISSFNFYYIT